MNKIIKLLLLMLALVVATAGMFSCIPEFWNPDGGDPQDPSSPGDEESGDPTGNETDGASDEEGAQTEFVMKAMVTAIEYRVVVDVIEAPYTSGVHWVITNDDTKFIGLDGRAITRGDLAVGDVVEITYSGQVMMSYPPQIVAQSIKVLSH